MNRKTIRCPSCEASLSASGLAPGTLLRCGKCKQVIRVPAGVNRNTAAAQGSSQPTVGNPSEPPSGFFAKFEHHLQQAEAIRRQQRDPPLRGFLMPFFRWSLIAALPLLIAFVCGVFFESVAMVSIFGTMVIGIAGMLFAQIWLSRLLFRESRTVGWLCTLFPHYTIMYVQKRQGPTLKPVAVFVISALTFPRLRFPPRTEE